MILVGLAAPVSFGPKTAIAVPLRTYKLSASSTAMLTHS